MPPTQPHHVPNSVIGNINTVLSLEEQSAHSRQPLARLADWIGGFVGSIPFAAVQIGLFVGWVVVNAGLWPRLVFDPFPFSLLGTCVSCEAVILTTFVLITQRRQDAVAEKRSHLDLQVNLLTEREVTQLLQLVQALADKLDVNLDAHPELDELSQDVGVEKLAHHLGERVDGT